MATEHPFDEDETLWDSANRKQEINEDARGCCQQCGRPLVRVAEGIDCAPVACCRTLCGMSDECSRCGDRIRPGELHFECRDCQLAVCTACGPGVVVDREYDFLDRITGEMDVRTLHKGILHKRKLRVRSLRGAATDEEFNLATRVVSNMQRLSKQVAAEEGEVLDAEWPDYCETIFGAGSGASLSSVIRTLTAGVQREVQKENSLVEVDPPCKVFGDIHGQLRDMLLFFAYYGMPGTGAFKVIFNGDFVDRGAHQLEVLGILMALKICYPDSVFLNRGNHEDITVNRRYGFSEVCIEKFGNQGDAMLEVMCNFFDFLPMACLIGGRILVLHGGIGDGLWSLEDLRKVQRPLDHDKLQDPVLFNILWSDPIEEDSIGTTFGVHSSGRSAIARSFGWNVTQEFCERNDLDMIVRSHQAKTNGFGFDVMHDEALIRVFSARDYEGHRNDGAILSITASEEEDDERLLVVRAQVIRSLTKA